MDICDRNTSSIACNEHIQTVMGQQKCKTSAAEALHWPNVDWADEQTLGWPIQHLQPWANRAASDGPMEGQCIRAIWDRPVIVFPCKNPDSNAFSRLKLPKKRCIFTLNFWLP